MKKVRLAAVATAIAIVLVAVLIGVLGVPGGDAGENPPSAAPPRSAPAPQAIGRALVLRTYRTTILVRPLRVLPLPASGEMPGGSSLGIELDIKDIGPVPYDDAPSQAASLGTRRGTEADRVYSAQGACGNAFANSVTIAPGSTMRGCLAYAVDKGEKPARFRYTPEDGVPPRGGAPDTGEWAVLAP